jgi:hypothetical protein
MCPEYVNGLLQKTIYVENMCPEYVNGSLEKVINEENKK